MVWLCRLKLCPFVGNLLQIDFRICLNIGNCIIDLYFKKDIGDMEVASNRILRLIAGVVEHGMFLDMATTVIIVGKLGVTIKNK